MFLAGGAATSQVQIWNNTPRELSFDLSWPAHCLTITPQHGVIDPQSVHNQLFTVLHKLNTGHSFFNELMCVQRCNLQILISPNPSLASKSALLPWSGQVYVQCDGQQKVHTHTRAGLSPAPQNVTFRVTSVHKGPDSPRPGSGCVGCSCQHQPVSSASSGCHSSAAGEQTHHHKPSTPTDPTVTPGPG